MVLSLVFVSLLLVALIWRVWTRTRAVRMARDQAMEMDGMGWGAQPPPKYQSWAGPWGWPGGTTRNGPEELQMPESRQDVPVYAPPPGPPPPRATEARAAAAQQSIKPTSQNGGPSEGYAL